MDSHEPFTPDLMLLVAPLLFPDTLQSAAAVCRPWRCLVASYAASAGGLRPWLGSSFLEKLEADSFELCRLAADSEYFDLRHYSLGLIVVTKEGEDPLDRALDLLERLNFVPLPSRGNCAQDSGWEREAVQSEVPTPAAMGRELQRQWAPAYIGDACDDISSKRLRSLSSNVVARWHALWSFASCVMPMVAAGRDTVRRSGLRGDEWWCSNTLSLSTSPLEETAGASLAGVSLTYWEKRLMG
mmetsp:Transcript_102716/g.203950  ORF Transcript_102716/g.203950 Transcript_102716/m.203950 type:complete len:242 (-) Transcript_102716:120-845(-)